MLTIWGIFLSTPSARRATGLTQKLRDICQISIHALREEGDVAASSLPQAQQYFYPRPPRGGRPSGIQIVSYRGEISIHALHEEGDTLTQNVSILWGISIHALREEGDCAGRKQSN